MPPADTANLMLSGDQVKEVICSQGSKCISFTWIKSLAFDEVIGLNSDEVGSLEVTCGEETSSVGVGVLEAGTGERVEIGVGLTPVGVDAGISLSSIKEPVKDAVAPGVELPFEADRGALHPINTSRHIQALHCIKPLKAQYPKGLSCHHTNLIRDNRTEGKTASDPLR